MIFTENYWWMNKSCTPLFWLPRVWSFNKLHLHRFLRLAFRATWTMHFQKQDSMYRTPKRWIAQQQSFWGKLYSLQDLSNFYHDYYYVTDIMKFSYSNCKRFFFTTIKLKGSICSFSSTVVITIYNFFIFQNYIPKSFFSGVLTD